MKGRSPISDLQRAREAVSRAQRNADIEHTQASLERHEKALQEAERKAGKGQRPRAK